MKTIPKIAQFMLWLLLFVALTVSAQPPQGYYNNAEGLQGEALKAALHNIIKNHQPRTYSQLWQDFFSTDKKPNGKVWCMYSDVPNGTPAYEYTFFTNQCGNYTAEGQCYNREHSWPASWFGSQHPMYTDLFHIVPTDGFVNNRRANYPFAKVGQTTWLATNGGKLGHSVTPGYSGIAFEPIDAYKGDFARGLMYMSVRYFSQDGNWPSSEMTDGAAILPWARTLLLQWHQQDPVSQKEIDRNNAVFAIQLNRNPFIDRPEFASLLWDPSASTGEYISLASISVWPNPGNGVFQYTCTYCKVDEPLTIRIYDASGRTLTELKRNHQQQESSIDLEYLQKGLYFLQFQQQNGQTTSTKILIH